MFVVSVQATEVSVAATVRMLNAFSDPVRELTLEEGVLQFSLETPTTLSPKMVISLIRS